MRILLVDDDDVIVTMLEAILAEHNYIVDTARDGEMGWQLAETAAYDLVLLDVGLPKLDGISFCRRLRQQKQQVLVMLLTARDATNDKLLGLDSGADDYVVKPFDAQELVARIRALLRRSNTATSSVLTCGKLCLDPATREVTCAGQTLQFSRKAYLILELFLRNQQRVFSRSDLVEQVWSFTEDPPDEDTVKSHIKNIRRQLKAVGAGDLIETLYGQGYRINPEYLKQESPEVKQESSEAALLSTKQQTLELATAEIWQRTQGLSFERLTLLEQAIHGLKSTQMDDEPHQQAIQAAHKLAGSLGIFGFEQASDLAKQIEIQLQSERELRSERQARSRQKRMQQLERLVLALRQELSTPQQETRSIPDGVPSFPETAAKEPELLILDSDRTLAEQIATVAAARRIQTAIVTDWLALQPYLAQHRPDVVLFDPTAFDQSDGLRVLAEVAAQLPSVPILIFSPPNRELDQVAIVKSGGAVLLHKPLAAAEVLQAILDEVYPACSWDTKVLAVDDDPQILMTLEALLNPHGIQVKSLSETTHFWEVLNAVQPDLLILDINLPQVSGLELCQAVRRSFQWKWLPILFLTVQADRTTLQQVFTVGADDYVAKPIVAEELLTRVLNRLQRSQLLKRYQVEPSLIVPG